MTVIPKRDDERGFAMVALLVGMAIAAIWMTAALPSWRQQVQRTREEDLIFRGEQYARAIMLYQDKNRGQNPPSIDILVSQHYLRKKWKDPITNDEFFLVGIGVVQAPGPVQTPQATPAGVAGPGRATSGAPINNGGNNNPGITGVRSKSTATSIKIYKQQQQHNLWPFDAATYRADTGQLMRQQGGQQPGRQGQPGDRGGTEFGPGRGGAPGGAGPGRGGDAGGARPVPPGGATGGRGGGRGPSAPR